VTLSAPQPTAAADATRRRRLCVFCGAKMGARPAYAEVARELGALAADRGLGLVYGGTSIGLMGQVAEAALSRGAEVIGVLPTSLVEKEIAHPSLARLHVVDSLAQRKQIMFDLSDAFLALPGGTGTLDEVTEMLTWAQLGFHSKPMGMLNTEGYYDGLMGFLRHAVQEGFVNERHAALIAVEDDPARLLDALLPPDAALPGSAGA